MDAIPWHLSGTRKGASRFFVAHGGSSEVARCPYPALLHRPRSTKQFAIIRLARQTPFRRIVWTTLSHRRSPYLSMATTVDRTLEILWPCRWMRLIAFATTMIGVTKR